MNDQTSVAIPFQENRKAEKYTPWLSTVTTVRVFSLEKSRQQMKDW